MVAADESPAPHEAWVSDDKGVVLESAPPAGVVQAEVQGRHHPIGKKKRNKSAIGPAHTGPRDLIGEYLWDFYYYVSAVFRILLRNVSGSFQMGL